MPFMLIGEAFTKEVKEIPFAESVLIIVNKFT